MRDKVVHMTSVHTPFDTRVLWRECAGLARAGYDVVLVAPHDEDASAAGCRIHAVARPGGRVTRVTRTVWQVVRAALRERARIHHIHDPELIPAALALRLLGKTVIYDAHEDLPRDIAYKHYLPAWLRPLVAGGAAAVEWVAGRALSAVVAATPEIAARFPLRRCTLVQNFPQIGEFTGIPLAGYAERAAAFAYVGDLTEPRGVREMVIAAADLARRGGRLELAGRFGRPELADELLGGTPPGVLWRGWQSREQVREMLANARAGLCVLHPLRSYRESRPIKLFEYMSAGLPLVVSDFPLWRRLLEPCECALFVDPLRPEAIAEAMAWILDHPGDAAAMGARGREAVLRDYNWETQSERLLALYGTLLQPAAPPAARRAA